LGLFLGCAASALKVLMLEHSIGSAVDMGKDAAPLYAVGMYTLRVLLTGFILIASAFSPFISVWGTACGLLCLSLSAYACKLFERLSGKEAL
jgi:hypothetical protein